MRSGMQAMPAQSDKMRGVGLGCRERGGPTAEKSKPMRGQMLVGGGDMDSNDKRSRQRRGWKQGHSWPRPQVPSWRRG